MGEEDREGEKKGKADGDDEEGRCKSMMEKRGRGKSGDGRRERGEGGRGVG